MSEYLVRLIERESGEIHPIFTTKEGRPLVLPNVWADDLARYRRLNTVRSYLADLIPLYRWAASSGIDLHQRITSFAGLRRLEIQGLVDALYSKSKGDVASASTGQRRIQAVRSFFSFVFDVYCDLSSEPELRRRGELVKTRLLELLARYGTMHRSKPARNRAMPLSAGELETVYKVLHPESEINPFQGYELRLRNLCLFVLAIEAWARRSEIVLIEVSDVAVSASPTVKLKQPSTSVSRKRRDGAGFKTKTREVPISNGLAELLSFYMREVRPQLLPKGTISTALFPSSRDGRRLSVGTVNTILAKVAKVEEVAALGMRLHPHCLRASGANEFLLAGNAQGVPNIQDCMEYMGGWSHRSSMPSHYANSAVREQINAIVRRKQ